MTPDVTPPLVSEICGAPHSAGVTALAGHHCLSVRVPAPFPVGTSQVTNAILCITGH
jgi:hypothetical protein